MEFTHKTHTYITEAVIAYSLLYIPIECMSFRGIPIAGKRQIKSIMEVVRIWNITR